MGCGSSKEPERPQDVEEDEDGVKPVVNSYDKALIEDSWGAFLSCADEQRPPSVLLFVS